MTEIISVALHIRILALVKTKLSSQQISKLDYLNRSG